MPLSIPLNYYNQTFAHALIDETDELSAIPGLGYYSVVLPRPLRHIASKRPDIILAMLVEDPRTRSQCSVFLSVAKTQVKLTHMVLRPQIIQLVHDAKLAEESGLGGGASTGGLTFLQRLNQIRSVIGRVVHANQNRLDCRISNLRELTVVKEIE